MPQFPRAIPGTPFEASARTHNALVDLLNQKAKTRRPQRHSADAGTTRVLVKANADYPRFGVIGLSAPLFTPATSVEGFTERVVFQGATPAAANQFKFGILQDQAATNDIRSAVVDGVTPAMLYAVNASHQFADVKAGDKTQLTSAPYGGAQILWRETPASYPSPVFAVVRLGLASTPIVLGRTDTAINKPGSGAVSVYAGSFPNEADTGENVTAINRFANVSSAKWVACAWLNGAWHLIAAEC